MSLQSTSELSHACHILFGPEVEASVDFLQYLKPSGIKAAYRKKARETHPDRARILGKSETAMNELFKEVVQAYEKLNSAIRKNGTFFTEDRAKKPKPAARPATKPRPTPGGSAGPASAAGKKTRSEETGSESAYREKKTEYRKTNHNFNRKNETCADHFYQGRLPRRELLIGQYLYYSGIISWRTLIESILWQRNLRPAIGEIAVEWGLLDQAMIRVILMDRKFGEKFGECAVRKRHLSNLNLKVLLWKQQRMQKPICGYFIRKNILNEDQVKEMVEALKIHNRNAIWKKW